MKYINLDFNYKKAVLKKTSVLLGAIIISTSIVGCKKSEPTNEETNTTKVVENNNEKYATDNSVYEPNRTVEDILNENNTTKSQTNTTTNKTQIKNNNTIKNKTTDNNSTKQSVITKKPNIVTNTNNCELKTVALTFDDGPSMYTNDLLDVLKEYNIKATFFVTGENIAKYPDVIKRMYNEGHSIGIHGLTHKSFNKLGIRGTRNEIDICEDLLDQLDVKWNGLVRAPYGDVSEDIKNSVDAEFILWNVDSEDWKTKNPDLIVKEINDDSIDGSIVLLHDIYPTSVQAIRQILADYKDGYNFVTVDQMQNNKVNNKVYIKK